MKTPTITQLVVNGIWLDYIGDDEGAEDMFRFVSDIERTMYDAGKYLTRYYSLSFEADITVEPKEPDTLSYMQLSPAEKEQVHLRAEAKEAAKKKANVGQTSEDLSLTSIRWATEERPIAAKVGKAAKTNNKFPKCVCGHPFIDHFYGHSPCINACNCACDAYTGHEKECMGCKCIMYVPASEDFINMSYAASVIGSMTSEQRQRVFSSDAGETSGGDWEHKRDEYYAKYEPPGSYGLCYKPAGYKMNCTREIDHEGQCNPREDDEED